MKDIDFDELDKAVSSLLGPTQKSSSKDDQVAVKQTKPLNKSSASSVAQEKEQTVAEAPVDTPVVGVGVKTVEDTTESDINDTPEKQTEPDVDKPAPTITPRRSGRFMDMVHPDAVVKEKPESFAPKSGRTLQPSKGASLPGSTFDIQAPNKTETKNEAFSDDLGDALSEVTLPVGESNNPDALHDAAIETPGLDMKPFKDWDMDGTSDTSIDSKESSVATTPFLAEAKVEKRPLGAFSDQSPQSEDNASTEKLLPDEEMKEENAEQTDDSDNSSDDTQFHATRLVEDDDDERNESDDVSSSVDTHHSTPVEHLPPELDKDIIAVESDGGTRSFSADTKREHVEPKKPGHGNLIASSDSMVSAASAMSIPKQYKEGAKAVDSGHSSLFDTDEYHPPLTRYSEPHDHKHTILWVIVALLLLIATAAGFGYWLYTQI